MSAKKGRDSVHQSHRIARITTHISQSGHTQYQTLLTSIESRENSNSNLLSQLLYLRDHITAENTSQARQQKDTTNSCCCETTQWKRKQETVGNAGVYLSKIPYQQNLMFLILTAADKKTPKTYVPHNPFISSGEKGCPCVIPWIYTWKTEMVNNTVTFKKQPSTGLGMHHWSTNPELADATHICPPYGRNRKAVNRPQNQDIFLRQFNKQNNLWV